MDEDFWARKYCWKDKPVSLRNLLPNHTARPLYNPIQHVSAEASYRESANAVKAEAMSSSFTLACCRRAASECSQLRKTRSRPLRAEGAVFCSRIGVDDWIKTGVRVHKYLERRGGEALEEE